MLGNGSTGFRLRILSQVFAEASKGIPILLKPGAGHPSTATRILARQDRTTDIKLFNLTFQRVKI